MWDDYVGISGTTPAFCLDVREVTLILCLHNTPIIPPRNVHHANEWRKYLKKVTQSEIWRDLILHGNLFIRRVQQVEHKNDCNYVYIAHSCAKKQKRWN